MVFCFVCAVTQLIPLCVCRRVFMRVCVFMCVSLQVCMHAGAYLTGVFMAMILICVWSELITIFVLKLK